MWTIGGVDNRELYLAATELVAANRDNPRSLADFLRTFRAALVPSFGDAGLPPETFVAALSTAFTGEPVEPDPAWRTEDLPYDEAVDAASVDRMLKCQVLDMEDAATSGALQDDYRSFGREVGRAADVVRATSSYYYNWDPQSYVECGVAGAFGGWEPGDDTGRTLVPGDVAVLTDEGLTSVPADQVERPVFDVPLLTWEQVREFVWCGQSYE